MKSLAVPCLVLLLAACGGGGSTWEAPVDPPAVDPAPLRPNILLIISDDQGIDASGQYPVATNPPTTPTIDALAEAGLVYDNVWATPQCAATRACLISGKFGQENGVPRTPGFLDPSVGTIQAFLRADPATADYANAVFGKWHLRAGSNDTDHPATVGIDHYAGNNNNLNDYADWQLITNGAITDEATYHTTAITDLAIDWIGRQDTPWFAWIAYSAPHDPLHAPPAHLHTVEGLTGDADHIQANSLDYYHAMIESMDTEIGRLLASLAPTERANTLVLFVGDNGTPRGQLDPNVYPDRHGKSTFFEGGLRVPFVASGAGVTRQGERDDALITTTDFFATIARVAGATTAPPSSSTSFDGTFTHPGAGARTHAFAEEIEDGVFTRAIRDMRYKLIDRGDGTRELYDLSIDLREETNLLPGDAETQAIADALAAAMATIR